MCLGWIQSVRISLSLSLGSDVYAAWDQELRNTLLDDGPPHHMIAPPDDPRYKPALAAFAGWLGEHLQDTVCNAFLAATMNKLGFIFAVGTLLSMNLGAR